MMKTKLISTVTILMAILFPTLLIAEVTYGEFDELSIYLEQNYTDQDTEVVIFAKGDDDGMLWLRVNKPREEDCKPWISNCKKRRSIFLTATKATLGVREFAIESPEPDLDSIKDAYPEGTYKFRGWTTGGVLLAGEISLSHNIPDPAFIIYPEDEADDIDSATDLVIQWEPVEDAVKYLIEIEREEPEPEFTIEGDTPASVTTFTVSKDWLEPNSVYQVGVAVVNEEGNITWVEQTFLTAE